MKKVYPLFPSKALSLFLLLLFAAGCSYQNIETRPTDTKGAPKSDPEKYQPFEMPTVDFAASDREIGEFTNEIQSLVKKRDFFALEAKAKELGESKSRFIGGGWKIHSFYLVAKPLDGANGPDPQAEIRFAQEWKRKIPESITARSSLARAYIGYAWEARGDGYSNTVSKEAWNAFKERIDIAANEIDEANKLPNRCHLLYEVMIALDQARDLDTTASKKDFDDAISFEPNYQYYYTGRAVSLMPRWGGRPGEWEAFADQVKNTIGGARGSQLYYLIVEDVSELMSESFFLENHPSWESAKEGFKSLIDEYGATKEKVNAFARLAFLAKDTQTTCVAFKQLSDENDFDPGTWKSREAFERVKKTAALFCTLPKPNNQAK